MSNPYLEQIDAMEQKYDLKPGILKHLIKVESSGEIGARSNAGAIGLTQLLPDTAKDLGVDPNDPLQNIEGGAKYLRQHLDKFNGKYSQALAAYNAGPNHKAVVNADWENLPDETKNYVKQFADAGFIGAPKVEEADKSVEAPTPEQAPEPEISTLKSFIKGNSWTNPLDAGMHTIRDMWNDSSMKPSNKTFGERYNENLKKEQEIDRLANSQHPIASIAGDILESAPLYAATGTGVIKAAKILNGIKKLGLGQKALAAAAAGTSAGIQHGYLSGIGSGLNQDELDKSTLMGGAAGGVGGAAGEFLGDALGLVGGKIKNLWTKDSGSEQILEHVHNMLGRHDLGKPGKPIDIQNEALAQKAIHKADSDNLYANVDNAIQQATGGRNPQVTLHPNTRFSLADVLSGGADSRFATVPPSIRKPIEDILNLNGRTSLDALRNLTSSVNKQMKLYSKSPDKGDVVATLGELQKHLDNTISDWATSRGFNHIPTLLKDASEHYKEWVVPYRDKGLLRDITTKGEVRNPNSSDIPTLNLEKTVRDFANPDTPHLTSVIAPKYIGTTGTEMLKGKLFKNLVGKNTNPLGGALDFDGFSKDWTKVRHMFTHTEQDKVEPILEAMAEQQHFNTNGLKINSVEDLAKEAVRFKIYPARSFYRFMNSNHLHNKEIEAMLQNDPIAAKKALYDKYNKLSPLYFPGSITGSKLGEDVK